MKKNTVILAFLTSMILSGSADAYVRLFFTPINGFGLTNPSLIYQCTNPAMPGMDCYSYVVGNYPELPQLPMGTCSAYLWLQFGPDEPENVVINNLHFELVIDDCAGLDNCTMYWMDSAVIGGKKRWEGSCPDACIPEFALHAGGGQMGIVNGTGNNCNLYDGATRTVLLGAFSMCANSGQGRVWIRLLDSGITYRGGGGPEVRFGTSDDYCQGDLDPGETCISAVPIWFATCGDCNCNGVNDWSELNPLVNDCNRNNMIDSCEVGCGGFGVDCNGNGRPDECDVSGSFAESEDCNTDGVPDECELWGNDCNHNEIPDDCDIKRCEPGNIYCGDCNSNSVPDWCELQGNDCNCDEILNDCESDIDNNGIPDGCEATDCNTNGVPDYLDIENCPAGETWCDDCNDNCIPDGCDLVQCLPGDNRCADCNYNDIPDECDITAGTGGDCDCDYILDECELDLNSNGVPDDCDNMDCNNNGRPDYQDIALGAYDCNHNCIIDDCDVSVGDPDGDGIVVEDCNEDYIPDVCEIFYLTYSPGKEFFCTHNCVDDCNQNGIPDECDITDGGSQDCNRNGIPDECDVRDCRTSDMSCKDCNNTGFMDICDVILDWSEDCNEDWIPDECQVDELDCNHNNYIDECDIEVTGVSEDCNWNDIPDECEMRDCNPGDVDCQDCNNNGVMDECDVKDPYLGGTSLDCQPNGIPDECDIDTTDPDGNEEVSEDLNENDIPDECEVRAACCYTDGTCGYVPQGYCVDQGGNWFGEINGCSPGLCLGDIEGEVKDRTTGLPLEGVVVTVEGWGNTTTTVEGEYGFEDVPVGEYTVKAEKSADPPLPDYYSRSWKVTVEGRSTAKRDFDLRPDFPADSAEIIEVSGRHLGATAPITFLDTVSYVDNFSLRVDWNYHNYRGTPRVRWITSRSTYVDEGTWDQEIYTRGIDVGTDFGPGGILTVIADAGDGTHSAPYVANFSIAPRPVGMSDADISAGGSGSKGPVGDFMNYFAPSISGDQAIALVEGALDRLPSKMHMFGGKLFKLKTGIQVGVQVLQGGTIRTKNLIDCGPSHGLHTEMGGLELHVVPAAGLQWSFDRGFFSWIPGGWFHLDADFHTPCPPVPIRFYIGFVPVYFRGYIEAGAEMDVAMEFFDANDRPVWLGGYVYLDPFPGAEATVGVGRRVLSVEGFLGGKARMHLDFPPPAGGKALTLLQIYLKAGVRLKVLRWTKTWSVDRTWTIFEEKGGYPVLVAELSPISRDFMQAKDGYAVFVANDSEKTNFRSGATEDQPLLLNVFEDASPELAKADDGLLGVFIADNPAYSVYNGTEVQFFNRPESTGLWSMPTAISGDGTADYHPDIAVFAGSNGVCAWEDVKITLPAPVDPDDPVEAENMLLETQRNMEITVANYDGSSGTWDSPIHLTDNDYFDFAPQVSGKRDSSHTMVTWLSDPSNTSLLNSNGPATLNLHYQRLYDGAPYISGTIATGLPNVIEYDMVYRYPYGWVVLAVDTDGNLKTPEDQELFAATYDGLTWTPMRQLTNDNVIDAKPQLAWKSTGGINLVWYRDGDFYWATQLGLQGMSKAVALESQDSSGAEDFELITGDGSAMAIVWQDASENISDLWISVFTSGLNVWGKPTLLTGGNDSESEHAMEREFAFIFDSGLELAGLYDKVRLAYTQDTMVVDGEEVTVDNFPQPEQTDLSLLKHTLHRDLAINSTGITIAPDDPEPGEPLHITAVVENLGDLPVTDVYVGFYDGDPNAGGKLIEEVFRTGPLVGGDKMEVPATWDIEDLTVVHDLYVVADPDEYLTDINRSNNTAVVEGILKPDLYIDNLAVRELENGDYVITVRVTNLSGIPADSFGVALRRDSEEGPVLDVLAITEELTAGDKVDLRWTWSNPGPFVTEPVKVYAIVDSADVIEEVDEDNNSWFVQLWNRQELKDCNLNGYADWYDISRGSSVDINTDGVPDECEVADQLHVVAQLPNQIPVGSNGVISAYLQSIFVGIPDRDIRFITRSGSITFVSGNVSSNGLESVVETDAAGLARVNFHADDAGMVLVEVQAVDTPLSVFAMMQIVPQAEPLVGDIDGDQDVDLADFARLLACLSGPGGVDKSGECAACMLDEDGDADLADFAIFQRVFGQVAKD